MFKIFRKNTAPMAAEDFYPPMTAEEVYSYSHTVYDYADDKGFNDDDQEFRLSQFHGTYDIFRPGEGLC